MIKPLNGKYFTAIDIPSYHDFSQEMFGNEANVQNITFIVTESCNLACSYCYESHKTGKRMSKATAWAALDMLFNKEKINGYYDFDKTKAVILDFIGGEPLLEIGLIDDICSEFSYRSFKENPPWGLNYMFSFSTNGILFDAPDVHRYFKKHRGKASIGISLDGDKELHDRCRVFPDGRGSYDIVSENAKRLLKDNPYSSTKVTFCPENIGTLFRAVKSLREDIGYIFINANCVFEEGWTEGHAETFYQQLVQLADYIIDNHLYDKFYISLFDETIGKPDADMDKNWCGGNGQMLAIGVDGVCYPCVRFAPVSLQAMPPLVVGNVFSGLMKSSQACETCRKLKAITLRSQSPQKCLDCEIKSGCALCSGYNYEKFGDANIRATFICPMHKARVKANQYYWDRLKKEVG